jgi:N-ethylmaleimide reductase
MSLFKSIKFGAIEAQNRFVMAPLTRCRATPRTHLPTPVMAEYYAQRASAGLIIAEATMIAPNASAFYSEPGIYNKDQIKGWRAVTDAVHAKGGKIALQIWHGGRACHSINGDNAQQQSQNPPPVAPSAIAIDGDLPEYFTENYKKVPYEVPRALADEEMPGIIALYAQAAKNAIEAGFDGVEVHGANGYLIDEFLKSSANKRAAGIYSGLQVASRAQFALDVVRKVADAIGADRTGIRLSPLNSFNSMKDPETEALTRFLGEQLSPMGLAFLHVMRSDFMGKQKGDAIQWARQSFAGPLIANMGYKPEEAEHAIATGAVDAVAFGTLFMANPDLPERVKQHVELNAPDFKTAYTHTAKGYTDYPFLSVQK